ncbi:Alkaline phosphatase, tissue-nonspecific isozyme [Eumeta japonica]|uniref:Alkaline phosphatase n=1 Tax=Eumeta variegata TaxID=151549 RepID=A0A4C1YDD1_EUMVA|nr:Alkaline phosphatase, tissue-nonspecific isozyme [Eumeta japonica]
MAQTELEDALRVKWNLNVAKNVIVFIGDGMDPNTVTATRIYKSGESSKLSFERFPHMGLLKTYSANKMVPDSGSTATALFCGVKVNHETVGVDTTVRKGDCVATLNRNARLDSLVVHAQDAGKSTGLVTTMRVTHATPAPLYAHSANRRWECEANMPKSSPCKDIARQLVEDEPGKNINVQYNARNSAAPNCLRVFQCAGSTLPDPSSSQPYSSFTPLRRFHD